MCTEKIRAEARAESVQNFQTCTEISALADTGICTQKSENKHSQKPVRRPVHRPA